MTAIPRERLPSAPRSSGRFTRGTASFLIPNPWDVGTARMLAALGFEALATTSAGHAFSVGQDDNTLTREATLAHAREIVAATDLPGQRRPRQRLRRRSGRCRRDDSSCGRDGARRRQRRRRDLPGRTARVRHRAGRRARARGRGGRACVAGAAGAHGARRELHRRPPDLADTIKRLQAFQDAGADVLYAPGLKTIEDVRTVVRAVDRPVNVLAGHWRRAVHDGGFGRGGRAARQHGLCAGARGPRRVPARRHRDAPDGDIRLCGPSGELEGDRAAAIALGTTRPSPQRPGSRRPG